jgi:hypothetical protein
LINWGSKTFNKTGQSKPCPCVRTAKDLIGRGGFETRPYVSVLFFILIGFFLLPSCAVFIRRPSPYSGTLEDLLEQAAPYGALKGSFWMSLEQPGHEKIQGETAMELDGGRIKMRFYRMGFMVGQFPDPNDEKYRYAVDALRQVLLWWRMQRPYRKEFTPDGRLILATSGRTLVLDARTLLPLKQTIKLESESHPGQYKDGEAVATYSDYDDIDQGFPVWYPGKIHVEYPGYAIDMKVEKISLVR